MLIAPVAKDKLSLLSIESVVIVSSYTALKPEPAVYVTEPLESGDRFVFFSDIAKLNGIDVSLDDGGLLKASGLIKRKFNLPQPGDLITTGLVETDFKNEQVELEVTSVSLSGRDPHSLVVKAGKSTLTLLDIQGIKRKRGFEEFNRKAFLKYYIDYLPLGAKV